MREPGQVNPGELSRATQVYAKLGKWWWNQGTGQRYAEVGRSRQK